MEHQTQRIYDEMGNKRQRIEKKFSRITYFDQIQTLVKKKNVTNFISAFCDKTAQSQFGSCWIWFLFGLVQIPGTY